MKKKLSFAIILSLMVLASCKNNEQPKVEATVSASPTELSNGEIIKSTEKESIESTTNINNEIENSEALILGTDYKKYEGQPISEYAKDALSLYNKYLTSENGLQNIKNNYRRPITRQEMAKLDSVFIEKMFLISLELPEVSEFEDTMDKDILKIYNRNLITGRDRRKFAPESLLKREEAAACAIRTAQLICAELGKNPSDVLLPPIAELPNEDKDKVSSQYDIEVRTAYSNGFMTGYSDARWAPEGTVTIEEALQIYNNIYKKLMEQ